MCALGVGIVVPPTCLVVHWGVYSMGRYSATSCEMPESLQGAALLRRVFLHRAGTLALSPNVKGLGRGRAVSPDTKVHLLVHWWSQRTTAHRLVFVLNHVKNEKYTNSLRAYVRSSMCKGLNTRTYYNKVRGVQVGTANQRESFNATKELQRFAGNNAEAR